MNSMNETSTTIARISELIDEKRKTPTGFAKMVGIDPAGFTRMLRGELTVTDKTIKKIATACGVNFEWLLFGTGDKYIGSKSSSHLSANEIEGGNAQALGDGSSATINQDPTDMLAIISRFQTQIEQMQADARAERERILADARAERERLYSLLEKLQ